MLKSKYNTSATSTSSYLTEMQEQYFGKLEESKHMWRICKIFWFSENRNVWVGRERTLLAFILYLEIPKVFNNRWENVQSSLYSSYRRSYVNAFLIVTENTYGPYIILLI